MIYKNLISKHLFFNKYSFLIGLFCITSFLFYNLLPTYGFSYSLYPAFYSIIYFLLYYNRIIRNKPHVTVFFYLFLVFISILITFEIYTVNEVLFLITFTSVFLCIKENSHLLYVKFFLLTLLHIYFLIYILEINVSYFFELKQNLFLINSVEIGTYSRGYCGLDSEPSFFVLNVFSIWLSLFAINNFKPISWYQVGLLIFLLLISRSGMILLVFPLIILMNVRIRYYLLMILTVIILSPYLIFTNSRASNIFHKLLDGNIFEILSYDASISSRLFYIIKDFTISFNNYLLPFGPGSYFSLQELQYESIKGLHHMTSYNVALAGSFLGYFIVQYGFLILIFSLVIAFKLYLKLSFIKTTLLLSFIIAILLQQITLLFSPLSFCFGIFLTKLYKINEC